MNSRKLSWWMGIIGGLFGWLAILSILGALISTGTAIFLKTSWWIPVILVISFFFLKAVMKEYYKEWKETGSTDDYSDTRNI